METKEGNKETINKEEKDKYQNRDTNFFEESLRELQQQTESIGAEQNRDIHNHKRTYEAHKEAHEETHGKHERLKKEVKRHEDKHKTKHELKPETKPEDKIPFKVEKVKISSGHTIKILRKLNKREDELFGIYNKEVKEEEKKIPNMVKRKLIKDNFDPLPLKNDKYSQLPDLPDAGKWNLAKEFKDIKFDPRFVENQDKDKLKTPVELVDLKLEVKRPIKLYPKLDNKRDVKSDEEVKKKFFEISHKMHNQFTISEPDRFYRKVKENVISPKYEKEISEKKIFEKKTEEISEDKKEKEVFHKEIEEKEKKDAKIFERKAVELAASPKLPELPRILELPKISEVPKISEPIKEEKGNKLKENKEIKLKEAKIKEIESKIKPVEEICPPIFKTKFIESEEFNKISEDISNINSILVGKNKKISKSVFENKSLNKNQIDKNLENIEKIRSNLFRIQASILTKLK